MDLFQKFNTLPVIHQTEAAECGLACVAMISGYYGYQIDLSSLRRSHPVSAGGATLEKILNLASDLGLSARPLKLELSEIKELQLPAILHWNLNHFVVLNKIKGNKCIIHDPASGERVYSINELSNHFTGIAAEFSPNKDFKKTDLREINKIWDLFSVTPGFYKSVSMVLVLSLMVQLAALAIPFYLLLTIDLGLSRRDPDWLLILAFAFLMIHLSKAIVVLMRGYAVMYFTNQIGAQMVFNVFQHFIRLPIDFFNRRNMSDLVSRFGSVDTIRTIITQDLLGSIVDGIFSIITLIFLFIISPTLFFITITALAAFVGFRYALRPFQKERKIRAQTARSSYNNKVMSDLSAIRLTKMYCNEREVSSNFQNEYSKVINSEANQEKMKIVVEFGQAVIFGIDQVATMYIGSTMVTNLELSVGQFMTYIFLKMALWATMTSFWGKFVEMYQIKFHLQRIADITFHQPEFEKLPVSPFKTRIKGGIEARDIGYTYAGFNNKVIDKFNLSVACGDIVALQGRSGSGKTTLLKALAGLIPVDEGRILVDGVDVNALGLREYRSDVAAIFHSDKLLQGSLEYNISLSRERVDKERLEFAAKLAKIDEVIDGLPMKYNTQAGDMSTLLSAGQVQRLLIARAIYKQPRILLLDEAMSNLGNEMAAEILRDITGLKITVILTTHNPEILKIADRVVNIEALAQVDAMEEQSKPVLATTS